MRFHVAIATIALCAACQKSDFSSHEQKKDSQVLPAKTGTPGGDATPNGDPAGSPSGSPAGSPGGAPSGTPGSGPCTDDGITKATLKTKSIVIKAPNQFLEYEIQLTDCAGKPKAISNAALKFDFDAATDDTASALKYTLTLSDGGKGIDDALESVHGKDLFGKSGPSYAYWRTKSVSFAAASATLILRIDVSNRAIGPLGGEDEFTAPTPVPTYLRLGDAQPVQQDVTFKPR